MEKKTNKAKLEIFKFLRKNLWKFNKYTLTRVFLHAEFISIAKSYSFNLENHSFLLIV